MTGSSDPKNPKFVRNIFTPGMADPWETLKVNKKRGLLAATNVLDGQGGSFMGIYWFTVTRTLC